MRKKLSLLTKLQFEQLSVQKDAFSRAKENSERAGTGLEYSNKIGAAGDLAQWARSLLSKSENQSLDPSIHVKS